MGNKRKQVRHKRVSKKGKPFYAGKGKKRKSSRQKSIKELNEEFNRVGLDIYGDPAENSFAVTPHNFNFQSGRGFKFINSKRKSSRGTKLDVNRLRRKSEQRRRNNEMFGRKLYGVPKKTKFENLPKYIQEEELDDVFIDDLNNYKLLVEKGEDPIWLRNDLIKRGADL